MSQASNPGKAYCFHAAPALCGACHPAGSALAAVHLMTTQEVCDSQPWLQMKIIWDQSQNCLMIAKLSTPQQLNKTGGGQIAGI